MGPIHSIHCWYAIIITELAERKVKPRLLFKQIGVAGFSLNKINCTTAEVQFVSVQLFLQSFLEGVCIDFKWLTAQSWQMGDLRIR
jgi:hypothetical protein